MGTFRGGGRPPARSPVILVEAPDGTHRETAGAALGEGRPVVPSPEVGRNGSLFRNHQERQIFQEAARDLRRRDARVKTSAIRALGRLKQPSAVPLLVEAFEDKDVSVRSECLDALSEIGAPAAAALFKRALAQDEGI